MAEMILHWLKVAFVNGILIFLHVALRICHFGGSATALQVGKPWSSVIANH